MKHTCFKENNKLQHITLKSTRCVHQVPLVVEKEQRKKKRIRQIFEFSWFDKREKYKSNIKSNSLELHPLFSSLFAHFKIRISPISLGTRTKQKLDPKTQFFKKKSGFHRLNIEVNISTQSTCNTYKKMLREPCLMTITETLECCGCRANELDHKAMRSYKGNESK